MNRSHGAAIQGKYLSVQYLGHHEWRPYKVIAQHIVGCTLRYEGIARFLPLAH